MTNAMSNERLSTGIVGLNKILLGGLPTHGCYLVRGGPGAGKTTMGLHFLASGAAAGERCLFVTLEESGDRIHAHAKGRGIDLTGVSILDISPASSFFSEAEGYDIFTPAEVEREPITRQIVEKIEAIAPQRVFIDPMTQLRYLSSDTYQFRRQIVSFLRFLAEHGATVLFTSEHGTSLADDDLQFMSDGVIDICNGPHGRSVQIKKLRGSDFRSGPHTMTLRADGVVVFPRLVPNVQQVGFQFDLIPSGIPGMDAMLAGGIERGTVTILSGASGVGKTTLGMQFMKEAASRGERSVIYSFEEEPELILKRCDSTNIPAREMIAKGHLQITKIEPLQFTPDEFDTLVRRDVEEMGARVIMIDSVAGYDLCLRGDDLRSRMHALAKYMQNVGVAVFIINEMETIVGDFRATEVGLSYLADNLVFLRFLELNGEMRKAVGVLKKRLSDYERSLREFSITPRGIEIGEPLTALRGILKGIPEFTSLPKP